MSQYTKKNGWYIDWGKVAEDVDVYKLSLNGSDEAEGLVGLINDKKNSAVKIHWAVSAPRNNPEIVGKANKAYNGVGGHLFAIGAEKSVDYGYGGYLYSDAADVKLLKHDTKEFGAKLIGGGNGYRFIIEEKDAHELLLKYNYEWR